MKLVKNFVQSCFGIRFSDRYEFAFLAHPRDRKDIFKAFGFLKFLPGFALDWFERRFCPMIVGKARGRVAGVVYAIPATAKTILEDRESAIKLSLRALEKIKKLGISYVSLGALVAPVAGKKVKEAAKKLNLSVTDGRAYTGIVVYENTLKIVPDIASKKVAIVGASLDVGKVVGFLLTKAGVKNFVLVDTEEKKQKLQTLQSALLQLGAESVEVEFSLSEKVFAQVYITLSARPALKLKSKHVTKSSVIVNDAQPWGFEKELSKICQVYQGGIVRAPDIAVSGIGFKDKHKFYSCVAEGLLLAIYEEKFPLIEEFEIGENLYNSLQKIRQLAKEAGFVSVPEKVA